VNATWAVIEVNTRSVSVFKGAAPPAINRLHDYSAAFLFASDFRKGRLQAFDTSFHHVRLMEDIFRDERIPHGFSPFNIQISTSPSLSRTAGNTIMWTGRGWVCRCLLATGIPAASSGPRMVAQYARHGRVLAVGLKRAAFLCWRVKNSETERVPILRIDGGVARLGIQMLPHRSPLEIAIRQTDAQARPCR
jgi:hypothetical protein